MRSGPQVLIVSAAMISLTSFQLDRTKPPRPRTNLCELAVSALPRIAAQASTGARVWRASRHALTRRLRTSGYLIRLVPAVGGTARAAARLVVGIPGRVRG